VAPGPASRAVIGDLLERQASSAVGGVRDVDPVGVLLHPLPAEDGRPEPGGDVGVRAVHDDVHQLADRGAHPMIVVGLGLVRGFPWPLSGPSQSSVVPVEVLGASVTG